MASPNYGYEKRQRELAKKRKKEDKLKAKADRKNGLLPEGEGGDETEVADEASGTTEAANDPAAPSTPA